MHTLFCGYYWAMDSVLQFFKLDTINVQVYQENIYVEGVKFQSFHKILHDMGPEVSDIQMVSFNSTSKGYFGE